MSVVHVSRCYNFGLYGTVTMIISRSIRHVLVKGRRPVISLVALLATMKTINRGYPDENW